MKAPLRIAVIRVSPLAIPMRVRFEHAAAIREVADPIIVAIEAAPPYEGFVGYGETLARTYVTGETAESVVGDVGEFFASRLVEFQASTYSDALAQIDVLPMATGGRSLLAARAAVELALLDLAGRVFGRRPSDAAGWLGLPGFGAPGALRSTRYSGIILGRRLRKLRWLLRAQRWYGLTDFKIKIAISGWEDRLVMAHRLLQRDIERGAVTLRADANGGWSVEEAAAALPLLDRCGVSALEQPLLPHDDALLPELVARGCCDLIADESLRTLEDAQRLMALGVRVLNVRLAKVGGFMPALRIAHAALAGGCDVQLGCLVGETSILSAAGVSFLEACPAVRFAEGAFGRWLLSEDVVRRPVQFGWRGAVRPRKGPGLGVEVDAARVRRLAVESQTLRL